MFLDFRRCLSRAGNGMVKSGDIQAQAQKRIPPSFPQDLWVESPLAKGIRRVIRLQLRTSRVPHGVVGAQRPMSSEPGDSIQRRLSFRFDRVAVLPQRSHGFNLSRNDRLHLTALVHDLGPTEPEDIHASLMSDGLFAFVIVPYLLRGLGVSGDIRGAGQ